MNEDELSLFERLVDAAEKQADAQERIADHLSTISKMITGGMKI